MIDLTQTPRRLKLSILNYALSGKLTKQLPTDGTADDLLRPILQKKHELLKDKKIRKHKRLPSVKEMPFKIPNNWTWIHFSSLYDMVGGSQPPKATFITHPADKYIRLYQTRDYGPNPKPVYIPKNKARKITNKGDILVARYGGSLGEIFRADHGAYNVALAKVTPIILRKELDTGYIWYYLKSDFYQKFVRTLNKSAQAGFNKKDLLKLIIPVPPLTEQKRIVQRLDQILPKIDSLNKDVVRLHSIRKAFPHRLKQSLLTEAMQGKLTKQLPSDGNAEELLQKIQQKKKQLIAQGKIHRHKKLPPITKQEIPFKIPSNWKWVRILSLYDFIEGNPQKGYIKHKHNGYIRLYSVRDYNNNPRIIYIPKSKAKKIAQNGDILLPKIGGSLGKVYLAHSGAYSANLAKVSPVINKPELYKSYLLYYFYSNFYQSFIGTLENKSAQSYFSNKDLLRLIIPIPPLAEQHRIVQRLNQLLSEI